MGQVFRCASSIAMVLLVCVAAHAHAGAKADLTLFSDTQAVAGDFRVFSASDGTSRTIEILSATALKNRMRYFIEVVQGSVVGHEEHLVVPGKKGLLGSFDAAGLELHVAHPKAVFWSKMVPGKPYRYRISARVFSAGQRVGKALLARLPTRGEVAGNRIEHSSRGSLVSELPPGAEVGRVRSS